MTIHRKQPRAFSAISSPRWLGYATAAAATAALGHAETAMAAVVVVQGGETFAASNSHTAVRGMFALGTGGADFSFLQAEFRNEGGAHVYAGGGASLRGLQGPLNPYASKLSFGQAIRGGGFIGNGFLASDFNPKSSQWQSAGTGYLGFAFTDAGGAETGWAEITTAGDPSNDFTLDEYAYSTAGESLTAGEVPEPGSLGLLALGGAGLLAWRKRRALAAAKPTRPA